MTAVFGHYNILISIPHVMRYGDIHEHRQATVVYQDKKMSIFQQENIYSRWFMAAELYKQARTKMMAFVVKAHSKKLFSPLTLQVCITKLRLRHGVVTKYVSSEIKNLIQGQWEEWPSMWMRKKHPIWVHSWCLCILTSYRHKHLYEDTGSKFSLLTCSCW